MYLSRENNQPDLKLELLFLVWEQVKLRTDSVSYNRITPVHLLHHRTQTFIHVIWLIPQYNLKSAFISSPYKVSLKSLNLICHWSGSLIYQFQHKPATKGAAKFSFNEILTSNDHVELALLRIFGHRMDREAEDAVGCERGGTENRGRQRQAVMSWYNQALLLESLKFKIIQTSGLFVV